MYCIQSAVVSILETTELLSGSSSRIDSSSPAVSLSDLSSSRRIRRQVELNMQTEDKLLNYPCEEISSRTCNSDLVPNLVLDLVTGLLCLFVPLFVWGDSITAIISGHHETETQGIKTSEKVFGTYLQSL